MISPTALSLRFLRNRGFTCDPVERFIAGAGEHGQGIRRDWGHFGDILAVHPVDRAFLLVQATSLGNAGARLKKARLQPELFAWLQAGGSFEVHGWIKRDRWTVKRIAVHARDVAEVVQAPARSKRRSRWQAQDLFSEVP